MTRETFEKSKIKMPDTINRRPAAHDRPFLPFEVVGDHMTPDFLPIGDDRLVRQTSSTHGHNGYITTDSSHIAQSQVRLKQKIKSSAHRFAFYDEIIQPETDTLVITYGVTARAARTAVKALTNTGTTVSLFILKTLWPVPEDLIREKAGTYRRIVVFEMNLGQYVREIRRLLPNKTVDFYGQMNGELISPARIKEVITHG